MIKASFKSFLLLEGRLDHRTLALFALIALAGGQLESFSWPANLLVFVVGGAFVVLGLTRPAPHPTRPLGRGAAWWLLPLGLFVVLEVTTFLAGSADHPTLSLLADPVLEHAAFRSLAWFGWLCGFWWLVRRGGARGAVAERR